MGIKVRNYPETSKSSSRRKKSKESMDMGYKLAEEAKLRGKLLPFSAWGFPCRTFPSPKKGKRRAPNVSWLVDGGRASPLGALFFRSRSVCNRQAPLMLIGRPRSRGLGVIFPATAWPNRRGSRHPAGGGTRSVAAVVVAKTSAVPSTYLPRMRRWSASGGGGYAF